MRRFLGSRLPLGLLLGSAFAVASVFAVLPNATAADNMGGALAGDKPFKLNIDKVTAKAGQPATVKVVFRAGSGYHVNKDFPTELRLKLPDGVSAQKSTLVKQDAQLSEEEGRFDVVLTASQRGKRTVLGELRFAVCTASTCDPQRAPISIEMDVQ